MQDEVRGGDVVLPGSAQLAPVFFGVLTAVAVVAVAVALVVRVRRGRNSEAPRRPPIVTGGLGVVAVLLAVATIVSLPPKFTTPEFPPIGRLFPEEAFFYRPATDLPVSPDSERWIAALDDRPLRAGFGGQPVDGVVFGVPFNPVDADTPREPVDIRLYRKNSYLGEFPIAKPAYIESMPTYGFDNHYVALDRDAGQMWELIATTVWFGRWGGDSSALWDLDELTYPKGSTMASGLPLLPGVLSFDEVRDGEVTHVVHAGYDLIAPEVHVWPARRTDGVGTDPDAPPMGAWLRLRPDVDLDGLGPQARVIAEGLQTYGFVISDTGGGFGLRGTPDARWDREDLKTLQGLTANDFEVVDASPAMVSPDSMEARQPTG